MSKMTIDDCCEIAKETENLASLAKAIHVSLEFGPNSGDTYEGAAYILCSRLYALSKKLKAFSCVDGRV